jgi:hypothetical protein
VFQAFLTTFLIDSGYKTPIQNMDELFGSGMKLAYDPQHSPDFENVDETEVLNVRLNQAYCPSFWVCENWALHHKNVSIYMPDYWYEIGFANGIYVGENGEPLLCRIDDGVFSKSRSVMVMLYGEPLLKRVNNIFGRVVEAGIYNYWFSKHMNQYKIDVQPLAIVNPLDGYYSFNLYHMQPAFHLLLIGLCLSAFCFVIEVFCYRI